jgi:hypothetical protein
MQTATSWGRVVAFAQRQWPLLSVLALVALSLLFIAGDRFRVGSVLLAMSLVYALLLRAFLPDEVAGLLVIRGKAVDLTVLGVLALGLVTLSLWVPPPS